MFPIFQRVENMWETLFMSDDAASDDAAFLVLVNNIFEDMGSLISSLTGFNAKF